MIFFFNDTATTEIYTLSLHDALPIFGSRAGLQQAELGLGRAGLSLPAVIARLGGVERALGRAARVQGLLALDRKSTRLNSSHANISYAVFCLKKKKQIHLIISTT